jgi:hypothetical protein
VVAAHRACEQRAHPVRVERRRVRVQHVCTRPIAFGPAVEGGGGGGRISHRIPLASFARQTNACALTPSTWYVGFDATKQSTIVCCRPSARPGVHLQGPRCILTAWVWSGAGAGAGACADRPDIDRVFALGGDDEAVARAAARRDVAHGVRDVERGVGWRNDNVDDCKLGGKEWCESNEPVLTWQR